MPEERKLVTILFADLVGSTEMALSHDPEVVRSTLGRAFESASEILREHGGTVEKFIGDAVMAVFGVPAATTTIRIVRSAQPLLCETVSLAPTSRAGPPCASASA